MKLSPKRKTEEKMLRHPSFATFNSRGYTS
jgi:hypothetical protein